MRKKSDKWGIVIKTKYSTNYIEKDTRAEVQAFFDDEHKLQSFNINDYRVFPPYSNLSSREILEYDLSIEKPVRIGDDD